MIPVGWQVPAEIRTRLGQSSGRQRAMVAQGQLLLVLHKVPDDQGLRREGVYFWCDAQNHWHSSGGKDSIGALRTHVETYVQSVEKLEKSFESATTASDYFQIIEKIAPIERASANLHDALQNAREAFPQITELITIRDLADDAARGSALLHSATKNALDYLVARQNEEQSKLAREAAISGHRLNLIAAFFLPLTAISGVFGMNLPSGVENTPLLFWLVFGFGALLGAVLGLVLARPSAKR